MPRMPMDGQSTLKEYVKHFLPLLRIPKIEVKTKFAAILAHTHTHNLAHLTITSIRYTKTGQLAIAGFCDPHKDSNEDDLRLWMPDPENPPRDLNLAQARFLLAKVADQFCDLSVQEKMAMPENMAGGE